MGKVCSYCGAPVKLNGIARYDPFFCDGYIVYSMRDYSRRSFEFVFYQGTTLKADVFITDEEIETYNPTIDIMPIVMQKAGLNG